MKKHLLFGKDEDIYNLWLEKIVTKWPNYNRTIPKNIPLWHGNFFHQASSSAKYH